MVRTAWAVLDVLQLTFWWHFISRETKFPYFSHWPDCTVRCMLVWILNERFFGGNTQTKFAGDITVVVHSIPCDTTQKLYENLIHQFKLCVHCNGCMSLIWRIYCVKIAYWADVCFIFWAAWLLAMLNVIDCEMTVKMNWKEFKVAMICIKVLFSSICLEKQRNPQRPQDLLSPKYKAGVLVSTLYCSVWFI
jgi:hypothetical protein